MNKLKLIFSITILSSLITACRQETQDIPDSGRKIVINGLITTDSVLSVNIGKSAYIIDEGYGSDNNDQDSASVEFFTNETLIDSLYYDPWFDYNIQNVFNPGNYRSKSVFPKPGKQYKVLVSLPGLPEASAVTTIPNLVKIINVDTSTVTMSDGNAGVMCKIEFNDPADTTNFYLVNVRETLTKDYFSRYGYLDFSSTDPIVEEGLYSGDVNNGIAFSDKLINGKKYNVTLIIKKGLIGSHTEEDKQTVCFRLYSVTEEYFNYIHELNLYNKELGNPLDEPVLVSSNVTGGYGMFSGAAVSSYPIVFKNER